MTAVAGRVSVALASYNGEHYLGEQLRSILAPTRQPDEVVVSDGGSSDNTVRIAQQALAAYPHVRSRVIADGARLGVGANFQRAIAATSGELIALSDQDDVWHPDRLARALPAFEDQRVLLTSGNARLVDAEGSPLPVDLFAALSVRAADLEQLAGPDAFTLLVRRNLVTGATVVFRRELLAAAEPFPLDWVHDEWLAILAAATGLISVDPAPLIDYRQHGANEIGVRPATLRYRIGRMLESRGDRYPTLARRSAELVDRLEMIGASEALRGLARRKAAFEADRANYDRRRLRRVIPAVRALRAGSYDFLSSQGRLDVLRDIFQAE
jgi:glycosyltransferase involved in cell wall biosynthesis